MGYPYSIFLIKFNQSADNLIHTQLLEIPAFIAQYIFFVSIHQAGIKVEIHLYKIRLLKQGIEQVYF
jgi:hypothetical protein